MVGDADDGIAYVVIAVGAEVCLAEGRGFVNKAAVFDANVKAGTDFIGDAAAVEASHVGVPAKTLKSGLLVVDGAVNETADARLEERIEIPEVKAADVGSGYFLKAVVNQYVVSGIGEMLDLLRVLVIQLKAATRSKEIAVADQSPKSDGCV